jgi:hypothetical protein
MFQLTEEEVDYMVSQNAIPSKQHLGGSLPLVFSEQGVETTGYTAFHKYVPKYGIAVYVVVEK